MQQRQDAKRAAHRVRVRFPPRTNEKGQIEKQCGQCKRWLLEDEFYRRNGKPFSPCKCCFSEKAKAGYEVKGDHKRAAQRQQYDRKKIDPDFLASERVRGKHRRSQMTPGQRAAALDSSIRSRARRRYKVSVVERVDRFSIIERDNSTCYLWCKRTLAASEIELDHVIPLSRNGSHASANLRVACHKCNVRKRDRLLSEIHDLVPTPVPH
jgi:5-methylcytosine-specific restriction endonuclease McrA